MSALPFGRPYYYKLVGRLPVPCDDPQEWALSFEDFDRRVVRQTEVGLLEVSTVFVGLDHSFGRGPPQLFETMIFGDDENAYQTRCSTWDEAERMHEAAVIVAAARMASADKVVARAFFADTPSGGTEDGQ